jgi:hypothetical protein
MRGISGSHTHAAAARPAATPAARARHAPSPGHMQATTRPSVRPHSSQSSTSVDSHPAADTIAATPLQDADGDFVMAAATDVDDDEAEEQVEKSKSKAAAANASLSDVKQTTKAGRATRVTSAEPPDTHAPTRHVVNRPPHQQHQHEGKSSSQPYTMDDCMLESASFESADSSPFRVTAYGASCRGFSRAENQDAFLCTVLRYLPDQSPVFVCAVFVGRGPLGVVAARLYRVQLLPFLQAELSKWPRVGMKRAMRHVIKKIDGTIREIVQQVVSLSQPKSVFAESWEYGTTLVLTVLQGSTLYIANVGQWTKSGSGWCDRCRPRHAAGVHHARTPRVRLMFAR